MERGEDLEIVERERDAGERDGRGEMLRCGMRWEMGREWGR